MVLINISSKHYQYTKPINWGQAGRYQEHPGPHDSRKQVKGGALVAPRQRGRGGRGGVVLRQYPNVIYLS